MRCMNNIKFSNSFEGEKYKLLVFIDITKIYNSFQEVLTISIQGLF